MLDSKDFAIEIEFLAHGVLELANTTDDAALAERLREIARGTLALVAAPSTQD